MVRAYRQVELRAQSRGRLGVGIPLWRQRSGFMVGAQLHRLAPGSLVSTTLEMLQARACLVFLTANVEI